jgi:dolichyl-phosphate-mannose-protein mannosyltransferase
MTTRTTHALQQEKPSKRSGKQPAGSAMNGPTTPRKKDYRSDGVTNHDIFSLPSSDWQLLGLLTVVAAVVRLFRIYQPTSVVFDEVQ